MNEHQSTFKRFNILLGIFLLSSTVVFWVTDLDIRMLESYQIEPGVWLGRDHRYFSFLYFPMNAILFTIPLVVGFPILILSFINRPAFEPVRLYRNHSLLLIVSTLLGAGLFNSVVLKAIFARPRPGAYFSDAIYYRPFEIATSYWGQLDMSFPSGHVSMAFVSIVFFFAFRYAPEWWQKALKWGVGVFVTIILGFSMILSRMSYGDHYLSDGIWAAGFTYYFILAMYYVLKIPEKNNLIKQDNTIQRTTALNKQDVFILCLSIMIPFLLAGYIILRSNGLTSIH